MSEICSLTELIKFSKVLYPVSPGLYPVFLFNLDFESLNRNFNLNFLANSLKSAKIKSFLILKGLGTKDKPLFRRLISNCVSFLLDTFTILSLACAIVFLFVYLKRDI